MNEIEKLKEDRMYLVAIIRELAEELTAKGKILASNKALFSIDRKHDDNMPPLDELLAGYAAEREGGKVPG